MCISFPVMLATGGAPTGGPSKHGIGIAGTGRLGRGGPGLCSMASLGHGDLSCTYYVYVYIYICIYVHILMYDDLCIFLCACI